MEGVEVRSCMSGRVLWRESYACRLVTYVLTWHLTQVCLYGVDAKGWGGVKIGR